MTTMDLKSISWVGDMYQRFESLCVEVEENMYQDTVKYVEDQMKTVGANVKKFYSEVMQDLLPPSPTNAEKEDNPILTVVHHADVVVTKKPKADDKKGDVTVKAEQMVRDSDVGGIGDNNVNSESCSSSVCSENKPFETTYLDTAEEQSTDEKFERQCAKWECSNLAVSADKDLDYGQDSKCSSSSDRSSLNASVAGDSVELLTHTEAENEGNEPLSGIKDFSSKSNLVLQVSHSEDGGVDAEQMTDGDGSVGAGEESKAKVAFSEYVSPDFDVSSRADIEHTITNDEKNTDDMELFVFESEMSKPLVGHEIESGNANKQGLKNSKELDKVKLGESCVLVEKSDDSFIFPLQQVQKSHKKKIRDLFSPRKWAKGKKDQEQLAVWYEQQNGKDLAPTSLMHPGIEASQADESLVSEWEIL